MYKSISFIEIIRNVNIWTIRYRYFKEVIDIRWLTLTNICDRNYSNNLKTKNFNNSTNIRKNKEFENESKIKL